jgi:hypothetical protein
MAARRIVANTEEGGHPYRPFRPSTVTQSGGNWARDLAGDSGYGGIILRWGGGGGAHLRCGVAAGICCGAVPLNELELNYVFSFNRPFFSYWYFIY